jgi:hypothetical protein
MKDRFQMSRPFSSLYLTVNEFILMLKEFSPEAEISYEITVCYPTFVAVHEGIKNSNGMTFESPDRRITDYLLFNSYQESLEIINKARQQD